MKGLEFVYIPGGWGENDGAYNFMGMGFAKADTKTRRQAWTRFPMPYTLIKHPTEGYIMYDVGMSLGEMTDSRPAEHRLINPTIVTRQDFVDMQLKQLGLTPDDITAIILSHCHWDHMGGLEFFRGTKAFKNIYVSESDFEYGLKETHRTAKGWTAMNYYRDIMDIEGAEFTLLPDEDIELFPGMHLIALPGHTPCVMGLRLELESSSYILPSDACTAEICLREPAVLPGSIYDSLGYMRSLNKLRILEQKHNAKLLFHHDPYNYTDYKMMQWIGDHTL